MGRYWKIVKDDYTMIYSGGGDHKNGVGIILRNEVGKIYDWVLANIR